MTDIYVGIDPGVLNCALVSFSPTRGMISAWKPKGPMPTGVLRLHRLLKDIHAELGSLTEQGEIKAIALEAYSMAEKYGQHNSGEVGGAIKLAVLAFFNDLQASAGLPGPGGPSATQEVHRRQREHQKSMIAKEAP